MTEKSKAEITQPDEQQPVDYAFWDVPESSLKVIYALPLFHEIDFFVNEGYRKIPHGGIETGGLLFGTVSKDEIRLEAYRPIECEHASGPSWSLSERDLNALKEQIANSATDDELKGMRPVGWFLAHTRSPLELNDTEAKQFDQFFPEPSRVSVLVKPERFQPTRFGFLVRKASGELPRDAAVNAVILPLPGRISKTGQMIPSLIAPKPGATPKREASKDAPAPPAPQRPSSKPRVVSESYGDETIVAPAKLPAQRPADVPPLSSIWKIPPTEEAPSDGASGDVADEVPEPRTPARKQLSRDRARVIDEAFQVPRSPATNVPAPVAPVSAPVPFRPPALPSLPVNAVSAPSAYERLSRHRDNGRYGSDESILNPKSVTALALAALFGCLVGYIAYLQLPAPVIPIDVRPVNQTMVVSWPPDETKNSMYAAIRLNDGPPVPLSAEEKAAGQVSLTAAKDFKVEVIARNWVRDSRGIVRYMRSANGTSQVIPADNPPSQ